MNVWTATRKPGEKRYGVLSVRCGQINGLTKAHSYALREPTLYG